MEFTNPLFQLEMACQATASWAVTPPVILHSKFRTEGDFYIPDDSRERVTGQPT